MCAGTSLWQVFEGTLSWCAGTVGILQQVQTLCRLSSPDRSEYVHLLACDCFTKICRFQYDCQNITYSILKCRAGHY